MGQGRDEGGKKKTQHKALSEETMRVGFGNAEE